MRNRVIYPRIVLTAEIDVAAVVVVLLVAATTVERWVISHVTVPLVDPAVEDEVVAEVEDLVTDPVIIVNK